jgi:hypothetical protein
MFNISFDSDGMIRDNLAPIEQRQDQVSAGAARLVIQINAHTSPEVLELLEIFLRLTGQVFGTAILYSPLGTQGVAINVCYCYMVRLAV